MLKQSDIEKAVVACGGARSASACPAMTPVWPCSTKVTVATPPVTLMEQKTVLDFFFILHQNFLL
ncbi:hypothetical protein [Thiorhodospira sibirica]|uniref:hypothetical protein n=1 Tax=Thiorhodospira sibirica TaxID=154347 RepID=UPI0002D7FAE8|nr:hypothetical protein [Thiorhodospira sibirica]